MTGTLRPLSTLGLRPPAARALNPGRAPDLRWLDVSSLSIDPTYQREIRAAGMLRIERIAAEFAWAKFTPVVVAPTGPAQFAIIDGQHRATAALLCGIAKIPCQIVAIDRAAQASAFGAINGSVTRISPLQLFRASVAAQDADAVELVAACAEAGVTIPPYPIMASMMKPGQTLAVAALMRCMLAAGRARLTLALQCIMACGDAAIGMVRGDAVLAVASVLVDHPKWCKSPDLLEAAARFKIVKAYWSCPIGGRRLAFAAKFREHIETCFGANHEIAAPAAPLLPVATIRRTASGGRIIDHRRSGSIDLGDPAPGRSALDQRRSGQ